MIQAYQQTMMRTELERLREENAEQRRLLERARKALAQHSGGVSVRAELYTAITQHLKGKA